MICVAALRSTPTMINMKLGIFYSALAATVMAADTVNWPQYRGAKFPEFKDACFFADYAFGRIIALRETDGKWEHEIIAVEMGIAAIGTDPRDGEILFANLGKGSVMRLTKSTP